MNKKMHRIISHTILPLYYKTKKNIGFTAIVILKVSNAKVDWNQVEIQIGDNLRLKPNTLFKKGLKVLRGYRLNLINFSVSYSDIADNSIQNKVYYNVDINGREIRKGIKFNYRNRKHTGYHVKAINNNDNDTTFYFRQSANNSLYIVVKKTSKVDSYKERIKIFLAYLVSKFVKRKIVLLFEKNSERYEESASILYEKLVDEGYTNNYFILDKNYEFIDKINPEYKKNIIDKYSFKHYLYCFMCETYIGTESIGHAIEVRIANKFVKAKLMDKKVKFVFLQHGVTYMTSLGFSGRRSFWKNREYYKVVVSSQKEANHFIEFAGFNQSDMFITGMPKFDRSYKDDDADKIFIMPTWRIWEYNTLRTDFTKTKYYILIKNILEGIPDQYKDKVIIAPHPLMTDMRNCTTEFDRYYAPIDIKYDWLLRKTALLITDYSSIAYDSFFRGSNVIFYWEQKDYCLENYGEGAELLINPSNIYGDIANNKRELSSLFPNNYMKEQNIKYINNYRKIVEFYDGHNTDRLVKKLKEERII